MHVLLQGSCRGKPGKQADIPLEAREYAGYSTLSRIFGSQYYAKSTLKIS